MAQERLIGQAAWLAQEPIGQAQPDPQLLMRPGSLMLSALPPLSLYIHLPWCLRKCPYCDFNSHAAPENLEEGIQKQYVQALMADLEAVLPLVWGRTVHTVFIGGGTPSLFEPRWIDALLAGVRARLDIAPGAEVTLEANPGTFEKDRFRSFAAAGVTRLSVGVQSFNDQALQALGRVHTAEQAHEALVEARDAFETFNLDLMYALPGQSREACQADLTEALRHHPSHLSIYHLTVEPNTYFAKYPPELPDDDSAFDMMDAIIHGNHAAGLVRYETSAFAKPGHRCQHNLNYWQFGDYIGIGAGAHSKLSFPHRITRQVRIRDPQKYMQAAMASQALSSHEEVARSDLAFEFMLNATRLLDGFKLQDFSDRTGLPVSQIENDLQIAESKGLIQRNLHLVKPTPLGVNFLSDLQSLFLPKG
jgi:oxygen-independent coproporphyrinogen-3 oxidase